MRPGSTSVRSPPTSAATTGTPQAAASRATRPKDSERLGTTTTSAARYQVESRWWGCGSHEPHGVGRGRAGRRARGRGPPRRRRRRRSHRRRRRGWASGCRRRSTSASASTATSRPLSGWMRPTKSSTGPDRPSRPSGGPGRGAVAGREEGVQHPGRHQLDARRDRRRSGRRGRRPRPAHEAVMASEQPITSASASIAALRARRRRSRPSPGRGCGTSRRAAGRARA